MKRVPTLTDWKIIHLLLLGYSRKAVAKRYGVSVSYVAKTKAKYPLLFWKDRRRYKDL